MIPTTNDYKDFFENLTSDYYSSAKLIVAMMSIPEPWILSIDRTQWKFGQKIFNILTLGIVHQGVAFPVLWWILDRKGNSNTSERLDLLEEFIELFAEHEIADLSADREFLGQDWLSYLLSQPMMPFRIRIRESDCLGDGQHILSTRIVFSDLEIGQFQILSRRKCLWGHWVYIGALRLEDNSLLVVIANDRTLTVIDDYAHRWGIETLFGIFKSRGFNLEDTHLKDSERLSRLFALLAIALCWAHLTGQWLSEHKPITIKKHGRKAKSIFRYGFDFLPRLLLNLEQYETEFCRSLRFLSCT